MGNPDEELNEEKKRKSHQRDNDRDSTLAFIREGIKPKDTPSKKSKDEIEKKEIFADKTDNEPKNDTIFMFGNKRIIFKKSDSDKAESVAVPKKKSIPQTKEKPDKIIITKPLEPVMTEKIPIIKEKIKKPKVFLKKKKIEKKLIPTTKKSDKELNKTIENLKKRNKKLEKENEKLERNLKSHETRLSNITEDKKTEDIEETEKKTTSKFFDLLGGKNKREELKTLTNELEERKTLLDTLETELTEERENINRQKNEFLKWREKLEALENEIENRRAELVEQERMFNDRLASSLDSRILEKRNGVDDNLISDVASDGEAEEHHEILDKIPEGAAILQRGILKQVNRPFVELFGYNTNELIDKSLYDFIVPESLSEIEKYYLSRLKGGAVTSYETVILTNDNRKIHVEISIKPMVYNGETADIAVVRCISDVDQESDSYQ